MKKTFVAIILLTIILCGNIVMATQFEELGMSIDLPSQYYDLKSGIDNDDSKITYYETVLKTTKDELKNQYETNGIIYNGISSNLSKELIMSFIENDKTKRNYNLTLLDDAQLEELKQEIIDSATGMQQQTQEIYENNNIKYIYTEFKSGTTTIYQYYTIVNGRAITITLNSQYSNVKQDELKEVVDTIQFNEILEKPATIISDPTLVIGIVLGVLLLIVIIIIIAKKKKN